jgi:CRISPR/Cas system CMR subunit Cmr4 (Cas7 group RAMP superfamily)
LVKSPVEKEEDEKETEEKETEKKEKEKEKEKKEKDAEPVNKGFMKALWKFAVPVGSVLCIFVLLLFGYALFFSQSSFGNPKNPIKGASQRIKRVVKNHKKNHKKNRKKGRKPLKVTGKKHSKRTMGRE